MPAPGMAGKKPLECHPSALEGAILADSLKSIGATGRRKPALSPKERRYSPLVKADNANENYGKEFFDNGICYLEFG